MPLMLRNRYAKDIGGISIGQKIIHNKPQEGVVLTPSLGIGGLNFCLQYFDAVGWAVGRASGL